MIIIVTTTTIIIIIIIIKIIIKIIIIIQFCNNFSSQFRFSQHQGLFTNLLIYFEFQTLIIK